MTVHAIVPQTAPPSDSDSLSVLRPLAELLKQVHAERPASGLPFCRALDRALDRVEAGSAYEPYTATYYRIQSHSRPYLWHYVTLHTCPCETKAPWCWHRALLHLLTAQHALTALESCPRPLLASAPRTSRDLDEITRLCDELC
jgi:hypothetical protein